MKIAVLTSSVGATLPAEVSVKYDSADYFAFTEEELIEDSMWTRMPLRKFSIDNRYANRRNAKIYKIMPHLFVPGYDYYIWVDATHAVKMDPKEIVETYLKDSDIALFKHPERDCVYEEAELIKQVRFDSLEFVQNQMIFYQSRSFEKHKGLYELPCRIQRNTLEIQALMLTWWELICKFSSRDQLSLPFALDMHGITPAIMPGRANGLMLNEILPQVITSDHQR
jgi:hypothetical protein